MMDKKLIYVALFFLCISAVFAQEDIKQRITSFTGSAENTVLVIGKHSSSAERLTLMLLKDIYPEISKAQIIDESDFQPDDYKDKKIILVGGPSQNGLSKQILIGDYNLEEYSGTKIVFKDNFMVFSDYAGFDNYARTSAEKSPLADFFPVAYVPAIASLISISLLWLWNLLFNLIKKAVETYFEGKVTGKIMKAVKKKSISHTFKGFHLYGIRIKYIEWASITIAALVFAAAMSYTYYIKSEALAVITLTLSVNLILYTMQNFLRILMDKHHSTHTQYHIWGFGIFLTLLSGFLGNTFGLAGYVSSAEGHEKQKTKIQFKINLATLIFGLLFFILNILNPGKIIQIVMISALSSSFLQLIPFTPYSGKELMAYSKSKWLMLFIPSLLCYLAVTLMY
jgi:hypothetical protein